VPATVRIDEIIATKGEPTFSFEFFPPRTEEGEANLRATPAVPRATRRSS